MAITLSAPTETKAPDKAAPAPPLLPHADGAPITSGGITLAVCVRETAPDDMRLCRKATGKVKDPKSGDVVKLADGTDKTETVWRPTARVLDIARAYVGGLLVPPAA